MNLKGNTGEQHGFVLSMHFQTGANAANSNSFRWDYLSFSGAPLKTMH